MTRKGISHSPGREPAAPADDAAQLRLIADNVPAMSVAYDERLLCTFANRRFAEFFGFTTATIVGRHLREVVGEQPYQEIKPHFDRVLAGERTTYKRIRTMPNGERRFLEVELIPHITGGRVRGLFAVTTDVTERKREQDLRTLGLSVAALIADADNSSTAIRSVIRAICESEGWECGRYLRPDADRRVMRQVEAWGIDDPSIQGFLARVAGLEHRPGVGLTGEAWQSGTPLWVADVSADPRALRRGMHGDFLLRGAFWFPVKADGRLVGILGFNSRQRREPDERLLSVVLSIGAQIGQFLERKHAEERLRDSEARFRTVVGSASDGILVYGADGRIVSANDAAERILGLTAAQLLGAPGFSSLLPCVLEDGSPVTQESRSTTMAMRSRERIAGRVIGLRRESGATTWIATNVALLRDPAAAPGSADGVYGAVMTLADITRLKRDEALLRLEQRVARAFDLASDARSAIGAAMQEICESENWASGRYLEVSGGELRHFADWCAPDPPVVRYIELSRVVTYKPGAGMVGTVWQTREPLWVPDIGHDPRVARRSLAQSTGTRAALAVPVFAQDDVIGVLIFQSREVRPPDERLLQAMHLIGGQIGQLLRRAKAEDAVRASEERFRSLCELSSDVFWEQDAELRFTSVGGSAILAPSAMLGKKRWELGYANLSEADWAAHRAVLEAHEPFRDFEVCRHDDHGREIWFSVSGEPVFDASGAFAGYRGVGRNITARKRDEQRIRHMATHDPLTELPNRVAFSELLNAARENARRHGRSLAVMFVDLDRFKVINDTLGHEVGDAVLCEAARRLRQTLRASDVVARLGGDEFVVMIPELDSSAQAETAARKVLAALVAPVVVAGRELAVTASIGISLYPLDGEDEQSLMKNADVAMYRAKEAGKNNYKFHNAATDRRSVERLALEASLRRGVARGELFLAFQPRVSVDSGAVTSVEALVRWCHPELGVVPPAEFIPLAEETGVIHEIGRWVLEAACAQAAQWHRQGLPAVRMAVNVSARQLASENVLAQIRDALHGSGLPAERLELEITESAVVQNVERAAQILSGIRALGVRVALDDFGTGYSSLAQLKRFAIDTLKIDRAFVAELPQRAEDAAIARAIITMGRTLHFVVVAEGVETQDQYAFLKAHGCDEVQGYLVSRPLSAEDCAAFLLRTTDACGAEGQ
jgi:diguanylate cyclase (GGDEF)-like protein/PAS domain S-box-containing protein